MFVRNDQGLWNILWRFHVLNSVGLLNRRSSNRDYLRGYVAQKFVGSLPAKLCNRRFVTGIRKSQEFVPT